MKLAASMFDRVQAAARAAADQLDLESVEIAVVLGSGLGGVADRLTQSRRVPTRRCPASPRPRWRDTRGVSSAGQLSGRTVALLCGRVHGYEGYPASEVGFGVRVVAALGVRTLIVTNAAGGVDPAMEPGEIVAISDHINLTGTSPLTGPNDERLGPRFVDMTDAYDSRLRALAAAAAPAAAGPAAARGHLRGHGRPGLRDARPRSACCGRWAPAWSGCRRCTR